MKIANAPFLAVGIVLLLWVAVLRSLKSASFDPYE